MAVAIMAEIGEKIIKKAFTKNYKFDIIIIEDKYGRKNYEKILNSFYEH